MGVEVYVSSSGTRTVGPRAMGLPVPLQSRTGAKHCGGKGGGFA
jgi:hypothetical protein